MFIANLLKSSNKSLLSNKFAARSEFSTECGIEPAGQSSER